MLELRETSKLNIQNAHIQTSARVKPTIANDVDADRLQCVVHRASERIMSTYFHSMVDFADKFVDLVNDQSKWSQATFGSDSERGPMGALKHMEKEARECQEAVGTPELREELADCLLLLLDASRRAGIKPTQLVEAAQAKMVKNKQRTWPKPTSDEPVEHVR